MAVDSYGHILSAKQSCRSLSEQTVSASPRVPAVLAHLCSAAQSAKCLAEVEYKANVVVVNDTLSDSHITGFNSETSTREVKLLFLGDKISCFIKNSY